MKPPEVAQSNTMLHEVSLQTAFLRSFWDDPLDNGHALKANWFQQHGRKPRSEMHQRPRIAPSWKLAQQGRPCQPSCCCWLTWNCCLLLQAAASVELFRSCTREWVTDEHTEMRNKIRRLDGKPMEAVTYRCWYMQRMFGCRRISLPAALMDRLQTDSKFRTCDSV